MRQFTWLEVLFNLSPLSTSTPQNSSTLFLPPPSQHDTTHGEGNWPFKPWEWQGKVRPSSAKQESAEQGPGISQLRKLYICFLQECMDWESSFEKTSLNWQALGNCFTKDNGSEHPPCPSCPFFLHPLSCLLAKVAKKIPSCSFQHLLSIDVKQAT